MGGVALVVGAATCNLALADQLVSTQAEYSEVAENLRPGDTIILADGNWADFEVVLSGRGTKKRPITLRAQTKGKVFITGKSNLRLAGAHLVVSGLVFKNGHTPTNAVISFRTGKEALANNSRVTEVVIDHFNNPERSETDFWVTLYGKQNRFDHNHLEGKSNSGATVVVRLDSPDSQNNHHRIEHNYFGPRPSLGFNGGETLRIGTSRYSLTDSQTIVANNYFERCDGETEIVSNKSGKNIFRGNVFFESRGTLTLRHGNDNLVEDNVFIGNRVADTGGIRVINKRQLVRNNYLSGLTGGALGGALVVMNGVPHSPIDGYHRVEDALIENNTIIDSDHIALGAGRDSERSAAPIRTRFNDNLIVNRIPRDSIAVPDQVGGIRFAGNVVSGVLSVPDTEGLMCRRISLMRSANGLEYPADASLSAVGVRLSLSPVDREDTGPSWYPKARSDDG